MRATRSPCTVAALTGLGLLAAGCAKPAPVAGPAPMTIAAPPEAGPRVTTAMTLTASPEANPDRSGRPSPVVVRVYQLRSDAAFRTASYSDLFDTGDQALGAEVISRDEYVLTPKESRTITIALSDETRFVGAAAGFRDILNAQWRITVPTPKKGLTIAVERSRLVMSAVE